MVAMVIRTPDYRLRVFISSTLKELAEERKVVRQAIMNLRLAPVMFESGARPHPAQDLYKSYLAQSQVFIGIYWKSYGWVAPGMHISGLEDEYNLSDKIPRLIYIKKPTPDREPALTNLLDRIRKDNTSSYTYFSTPTELKELVQNDLALLLTERFEAFDELKQPEARIKTHPPTNVPIPRNPLIGREHELSTLCDLLRQDDTALVTLTGPGGTGKSRLAIQIGGELLESFPDGVYMVRLESISDPAHVLPTIGETFNLRETPGSRPISEILKEFFREKQMLLILDNFEQVVEASPHIADLLEACPLMKCIVTSRTPLRLRAEREVPVSPLCIPAQHETMTIEKLSQYAAVQLFIQRAQAVKPDFIVTNANASVVAEICCRLDGLPLAIELAAAKIKLFTPHGLLTRLERRFDLLTGGTRDLPERQRTLRSAIDWSFNLLSDLDKTLFRRMSIFTDGCTLEAAEAVCNIYGDWATQMDDALASLIDNNLVMQRQEYEPEPRFVMLNTIHDYASEKLSECHENDSVHIQHAQYFLKFVTIVEPLIRTSEREKWQHVMLQEFGNIRGVLDWVCKTGQCIEIGQKIVIALGLFWQICGYISEGAHWCSKLLELCDDSTPAAIRAGLLCYKGMLTRDQSDHQAATEAVEKSLELCRQLDDKSLLGTALMVRGIIASATRELDIASAAFQEAVEIFKDNNDLWNQAISSSWLGDVALYQNDSERAFRLHTESEQLGRQQGDPWCLMPPLMSSAQIDMLNRDLPSAQTKLIEIVDVLHKVNDRWSLSWTLLDLGHVVFLQGNLDQAGLYLLEGLSLANTFGNLGAIVLFLAEAGALIAKRLQLNNVSNLTVAVQLFGATAPYIDMPGLFIWINTQQLYEEAILKAKSLTDPRLWEQGYAEGQSLTIDEAVSLAMQALKDSGEIHP